MVPLEEREVFASPERLPVLSRACIYSRIDRDPPGKEGEVELESEYTFVLLEPGALAPEQ